MPGKALKSPGTDVADEPRQRFRLFLEERRYVAANRQHIRDTYSGRYIAIIGTSILDSDEDFSALAERVYRRFGYKRIFMPLAGKREVYRIPSPHLAK
ncbi:MAG TPA: hypothetical protein VKM93_07510 [Terriglobia bacterium]|nr:hypothetical protein [Terriglobia bacterium]